MPNTALTRLLVDRALLAALPPGAVFINPGRGSVVDEAALAEALSEGRLAAAVLDVFQAEPLPPDHVPLADAERLHHRPHRGAQRAVVDRAAVRGNYRRLLAGQTLNYRVDFDRGY